MNNKEQIITKVAHLLKLAEGSSNPNEAAVAAAHAQRLMDEYRISEAEVADTEAQPDEPICQHGDPMFTSASSRMPTWLSYLANTVARANDCRIYRSYRRRKRVIMIVGRKSDVQVTHYLFAYCRRETERLAEQAGEKAVHSEASSTALVKLNERGAAVQRYVDENLNLRKGRATYSTHDRSARDAGREAGERINLRSGIGGQQSTGLLR